MAFVCEGEPQAGTAAEVRAETGFEYEDAGAGVTPEPSAQELGLLRGAVRAEMVETYPDFCARVWPVSA